MRTPSSKLGAQLWEFSKYISVMCGVWLIGYWGMSVAWVCVMSMFVYIWMFERHSTEQRQLVTINSQVGTHEIFSTVRFH